jgi:hypothetical protein
METVILIGIGILAAVFIVRQFVANTKGKGCASCAETCCSHHEQKPDDK